MVNHTLYRAIFKSMSSRYAVYGTNAISTILLARMFTPSEFGIVAAVMVFYLFFQVMAEAGLGPAIINVDALDDVDRDGIFSLTILSGFLLSLIFFCLGPLLENFYQIKGTDVVYPYVAASILCFSGSILPSAFLQKDQRFYDIGLAGVLSELISLSTTFLLVQIIPALHALSSKGLILSLINFILLYSFTKKTSFGQPKFGKKLSAIKPILHFSLYQYGFNSINYFARNLDNILVGKFFGAASLGIYEKAYKLMKYPLMLLSHAMSPAIQPVLRKHVGNIETIETVHRQFTFKLAVLGAVTGIITFLFSKEIILLLLGSQWTKVVPILEIFSLSIPVQVVLSTSGSFFNALNKPKLLFYVGIINATSMVTAIIYGIQMNSMLTLSWSLVVAFYVNFYVTYVMMYLQIFKKNITKFLLPLTGIWLVLILIYFVT